MSDLRDRLEQLSPDERAQLALRAATEREHEEPGERLPEIRPDPAARHDPFPLTELQEAYWLGRTGAFEIGDVAAHSYLELEGGDLEPERLESAWNRLVERHGMLRAVVLPDGRQKVLEEVPRYEIDVVDLREADDPEVDRRLEDLREQLSHRVPDPAEWPLFDVRAARLPDGGTRLLLGFDGLIVDAWSLRILLREWGRLYRDPEAALPQIDLSFRDYVLAVRELEKTEAFDRAREHWMARLDDLPPPPRLPLRIRPRALDRVRFVRRVRTLEPDRWSRVRERAAERGLTPSAVLLAAYADVLGLWSEERRFSLSVPRFNRLPLHPDVERLVGEFASFTLLEVDSRGEEDFRERARRHQERLWEDMDHALFDGVRVLREMSRRRDEGFGARMPVVFTAAPAGREASGNGGDTKGIGGQVPETLGRKVFAVNQTPQVWLDNHVSERDDGALVCDWDSVDALFPPGVPEAMLEAYVRHLRRLADDEEAWGESWADTAAGMFPPEQRRRRDEVNSVSAPIPDRLLHQLVEERAGDRPDAIAIVSSDRTLTYQELTSLARRWARRLREEGAGPERIVAVVMEKGWEQAVAALAVQMAGAAYLPIDPRMPEARREHVLRDGEPLCVLTQSRLDDRLAWPEGFPRLVVDEVPPPESDAPIEPLQGPEDLAYLLYTSGSTGRPKGVMIEHRGMVNAVLRTNERFEVGPDDTALGLTALHHDMSTYDLFGVLAAGGTLVLPDPGSRRDPAHWAGLMREHGVTLWNSVPAMMEMLVEWAEPRAEGSRKALPDSLRLAFLGGDWIPVDLPDRLRALVAEVEVVSVGGPTETTLWNVWRPVDEVDPEWKSIPYGRPIPNVSYHVMDGDGVERPDWVPGELCAGGVGLTRGYWKDEEATREKFRPHPRTGQRLFRTGDMGRWLPRGEIEFLGRVDFQVQIRGHRVELGEIEARLREHPAVSAAVASAVDAGEEERGGAKALVAHVVPEEGADPDPEALREHLGRTLPDYMIPAHFVMMDRLPLTRNGKVDRAGLPEPDLSTAEDRVPDAGSGRGTGQVRASPRDDSEAVRRIGAVVSEVLEMEPPDPEESLLRYGADSIDMVRIGNRLEEAFGRRPRIDEIFRLQTVEALAAWYGEGGRDGSAGARAEGSAPGEEGADRPTGTWDESASERRARRLLTGYEVISDPAAREAFKEKEPGLRRDADAEVVSLGGEALEGERLARHVSRRSHRRYSLRPVPADRFGDLLGALRRARPDGDPKYRYASPGGLYPTQCYVHVKPGRVEGVGAGVYYYHPARHGLMALTPGAELDRDIHIPFINAPIFDEAAFSLFLVARLDAIGPMYGERSLHFVTLEAGIMAHLLEMEATKRGLGLCQIGSVDFGRIRELFDLDDTDVLVHSLVGGLPAGEGEEASAETRAGATTSRARRLLERVRDLTAEEARDLLDATRGTGSEEGEEEG